MYDEDDHFSRWVQFLCAIPHLFIGGGLLYWSSIDLFDFRQNYDIYSMDGVGIALFVVGAGCLWYAITGKDNVNKDDF
jgi:hypothetical protein